ncbi:MCE family protein [Conexibacter sp. W3-3-2]|uniref:MlaD family protein n=1 Tax=Conexibacter sp. W3-3-2 TaxID=2675227 RepID=UPI0012B70088|nr:MlaD family protein [Conexibacter sp. W3-3-2]MTD44391.1 MCE family protein [Conexibacter sp. W3-3-2]
MRGLPTQRIAAVAALVIALAVAAVVLLGGSGDYVVKARFVDAGQLVKGNLVQVAGRPVGKVTDIDLTDDNQAELTLTLTDDGVKPLHRGTVAQIRLVGLSGVANRYLELAPGPSSGEAIPDGGVLSQDETRPVVDLDTLLNALDAKTRGKLQNIIKDGSEIFEGTAAGDANRATQYLNPAVGQGRALAEELAFDTAAVGRLVTTGAAVTKVLANRRDDVGAGITTTARALRSIADERGALQDALTRAPAVLRQARRTFATTDRTLRQVRPALRDLRPAAAPLADVLRELPGTARQARPVLDDLTALLPSLRTVLRAAPALASVAVPAVDSTTTAVRGAAPIFTGLRPYTPDLVLGLFNGLGGQAATSYDANGHFARIGFATGGPTLTGLLSPGPGMGAPGVRSGVTARCPGAAADAAPDGSSPYVPDESICDPRSTRP